MNHESSFLPPPLQKKAASNLGTWFAFFAIIILLALIIVNA